MTETDVKKMLSLIWDMASKAAKKEYANCVKRTPAIVISADNEIHYATVCLPDKTFDEDQQMYLMNCSGRDLKSGDSVLIERCIYCNQERRQAVGVVIWIIGL